MKRVDFEYAIKTDVRNNPIVREIDEARLRQFRRSLAIGGLLVAVALFSALQNYAMLRHGYQIQSLKDQMAAEEVINRRLRLEVEWLSSPERIERVARELKLVSPEAGQAIVIERVTPAAPPDRSVIAAR